MGNLHEELVRLKKLMLIEAPVVSGLENIFDKLLTSFYRDFGNLGGTLDTYFTRKLGRQIKGFAQIKGAINNGDIEEKEVLEIIVRTLKNSGQKLTPLIDLVAKSAPNFTNELKNAASKGVDKSEVIQKIPELNKLPDELLNEFLTSIGFKPLTKKITKQMVTSQEMKNYFPTLFSKKWVIFDKYPGILKGAQEEFYTKYAGKNATYIKADLLKILKEQESILLTSNQPTKKNALEIAQVGIDFLNGNKGKLVGAGIGGLVLYGIYKLVKVMNSDTTFGTQVLDYWDKVEKEREERKKQTPETPPATQEPKKERPPLSSFEN